MFWSWVSGPCSRLSSFIWVYYPVDYMLHITSVVLLVLCCLYLFFQNLVCIRHHYGFPSHQVKYTVSLIWSWIFMICFCCIVSRLWSELSPFIWVSQLVVSMLHITLLIGLFIYIQIVICFALYFFSAWVSRPWLGLSSFIWGSQPDVACHY